MPFVKISGIKGKFYVPEEKPDGSKKYDCADCFSCQRCSDDRCQVCHAEKVEAVECKCQKTDSSETQHTYLTGKDKGDTK